MFVVSLTPPLVNGDCYTLTGNVTTYTAGTYTFTVDDGVTTQTIGTVSASGEFSIDFTANADHTEFEFNDLFGADIEDLKISIGESCLDTLCSECFELKTSHACPGSPVLEFQVSNDESIGDLDFDNFTWSLNFLLIGAFRAPEYTYENEDMFKFSNGQKKMLYADKRKIDKLYVHEMPEYMHDALSQAIEMDNLTINGVDYIKREGDYSPDWDIPNSLLAPVILDMEEKTQTNKNSNCG